MPACIVYSSRTGNTRRVAEHLAGQLGMPLFSVSDAPDSSAYDTYALGFWTLRGAPDPRMAAFMQTLHGKRVFFFGTMAAWPDSPHAAQCAARAAEILEAGCNAVLGHFLCQGRMDPAVFAKRRHPKTPERLYRIRAAQSHPDADDLRWAEIALRKALASA